MQSQLDYSKFKGAFGINQSSYTGGICSALVAYEKLKYKK